MLCVSMRLNDTALRVAGVPMPVDAGLNADESRHLRRMRDCIAQAAAACGGWLSFEHYMDLALYAPGLGYYSAGARKLGVGGDFTTAPEISRLFGACVAEQCAEVLRELGNATILEVGPGTGRLAVDVLRRLDALGSLPSQYFMLEVSADLRERQRMLLGERVPHLMERVAWLDAPPKTAFDGVILANEVLDALPVARFLWHPVGAEELGVAVAGDELRWSARPASLRFKEDCDRLCMAAGGWDDGYVSEYCPRLAPWTRAIAGSLRRGAVLWFDYGLPRPQYYLRERHQGTLICHFRQRAFDDPLRNPGLQDLSAWVDFTALAEAGAAADFELGGFTTQAHFLAGLGIDREMQRLAGDDAERFARLAVEARQLLLPGELGERFKVLAWTRGVAHGLAGFALRDLRHSL